MGTPRLPTHEAGCRMPSGATIMHGDRLRREDAERGSERLFLAIERCLRRYRQPSRQRRPREFDWTTEEDATALRLRADNKSFVAIAKRLPGRSHHAVAARLRYLASKEAGR